MPKVTIWIRREDEEAWKSIINKPEVLHDWIRQHVSPDDELQKAVQDGSIKDYEFGLDTSPAYDKYMVDPITNLVYHKDTEERVPAKVKDGKIIELL